MKLRFSLEVIKGPDKGLVLELTRRESLLGRGEDATLRLGDQEASRHHCKLVLAERSLEVRDLGSANGTWVNGQRVERGQLMHGDVLRVGLSDMALRVDQAGAKGEPAPGVELGAARPGLLAGLGWRARVALLLLLLTLASFVVVALPMVNRQEDALETEALERASALVLALAALNREALQLGDEMLVDVKQVAKMEGVVQAYIYDRAGRTWSPLAQLHQVPGDQVARKALQADQFLVQTTAPGEDDLAQPIKVFMPQSGQFEKLGTARLVFSLHKLAGQRGGLWQGALVGLVISLLLALAAAYLLLYLGARPVTRLREQLEAVLKGDASEVGATQGTSQLSALAASINRGLAKLAQAPSAPPEVSAAPVAPAGPATPEQGLPLLAGAVGDPVLLVGADIQVTLANQALGQALGLDPAQVAGRHILEALPDQALLAPLLELIQQATAQPGQVLGRQVSDGQGRLVRLTVAALHPQAGSAPALMVVLGGLAAPGEAGA
ncbi:MAG: FHA domain-containing protein [Desulfarculus sp.]|nr:FHA domain-containing protein [Desulfarculus sp.]